MESRYQGIISQLEQARSLANTIDEELSTIDAVTGSTMDFTNLDGYMTKLDSIYNQIRTAITEENSKSSATKNDKLQELNNQLREEISRCGKLNSRLNTIKEDQQLINRISLASQDDLDKELSALNHEIQRRGEIIQALERECATAPNVATDIPKFIPNIFTSDLDGEIKKQRRYFNNYYHSHQDSIKTYNAYLHRYKTNEAAIHSLERRRDKLNTQADTLGLGIDDALPSITKLRDHLAEIRARYLLVGGEDQMGQFDHHASQILQGAKKMQTSYAEISRALNSAWEIHVWLHSTSIDDLFPNKDQAEDLSEEEEIAHFLRGVEGEKNKIDGYLNEVHRLGKESIGPDDVIGPLKKAIDLNPEKYVLSPASQETMTNTIINLELARKDLPLLKMQLLERRQALLDKELKMVNRRIELFNDFPWNYVDLADGSVFSRTNESTDGDTRKAYKVLNDAEENFCGMSVSSYHSIQDLSPKFIQERLRAIKGFIFYTEHRIKEIQIDSESDLDSPERQKLAEWQDCQARLTTLRQRVERYTILFGFNEPQVVREILDDRRKSIEGTIWIDGGSLARMCDMHSREVGKVVEAAIPSQEEINTYQLDACNKYYSLEKTYRAEIAHRKIIQSRLEERLQESLDIINAPIAQADEKRAEVVTASQLQTVIAINTLQFHLIKNREKIALMEQNLDKTTKAINKKYNSLKISGWQNQVKELGDAAVAVEKELTILNDTGWNADKVLALKQGVSNLLEQRRSLNAIDLDLVDAEGNEARKLQIKKLRAETWRYLTDIDRVLDESLKKIDLGIEILNGWNESMPDLTLALEKQDYDSCKENVSDQCVAVRELGVAQLDVIGTPASLEKLRALKSNVSELLQCRNGLLLLDQEFDLHQKESHWQSKATERKGQEGFFKAMKGKENEVKAARGEIYSHLNMINQLLEKSREEIAINGLITKNYADVSGALFIEIKNQFREEAARVIGNFYIHIKSRSPDKFELLKAYYSKIDAAENLEQLRSALRLDPKGRKEGESKLISLSDNTSFFGLYSKFSTRKDSEGKRIPLKSTSDKYMHLLQDKLDAVIGRQAEQSRQQQAVQSEKAVQSKYQAILRQHQANSKKMEHNLKNLTQKIDNLNPGFPKESPESLKRSSSFSGLTKFGHTKTEDEIADKTGSQKILKKL